jgi:hypothetical protein
VNRYASKRLYIDMAGRKTPLLLDTAHLAHVLDYPWRSTRRTI